jgi:MSHA biogenesis protein MshN
MSVINKMLRDLDQRNAGEQVKGQGVQSVASVPQRPVANPGWEGSVSFGRVAVVCGVIVVAAGGALWVTEGQWYGTQPSAAAPAIAVAPAIAAPAAPASSIVVPAEPASQVADSPAPEAVALAVAPAAPEVAAEPAPVADKFSIRLERRIRPAPSLSEQPTIAPVVKSTPSQVVQPSASSSIPSASVASLEAQRQTAARDAVASAQSLWNTGAKESAIALLQDVLASGERSLPSSSTSLGSGLLALVRELVRMQLADARPGAAWDLLVRLEPHIRSESELWAVRGNAAQRLGRHQDSVHAYTAALQLRPGEQRWLLGTAVSLAALGKNEAAADMAEKALAVGPISKEVQSYLRQMGVPVKD